MRAAHSRHATVMECSRRPRRICSRWSTCRQKRQARGFGQCRPIAARSEPTAAASSARSAHHLHGHTFRCSQVKSDATRELGGAAERPEFRDGAAQMRANAEDTHLPPAQKCGHTYPRLWPSRTTRACARARRISRPSFTQHLHGVRALPPHRSRHLHGARAPQPVAPTAHTAPLRRTCPPARSPMAQPLTARSQEFKRVEVVLVHRRCASHRRICHRRTGGSRERCGCGARHVKANHAHVMAR